jgi:hypothetical protein
VDISSTAHEESPKAKACEMERIERLRQICADGREIEERRREIREGWKPTTVVRLEWECGGRTVQLEHTYGLMAQLLPDRRTLAVLRSSPIRRFADTLEFIDANGETQLCLESPIPLDERRVFGEFAWFESPRPQLPRAVRVVFWARDDDAYYLLDVDADTGSIVQAQALA